MNRGILFLTTSLALGGAEEILVRVALGLRSRGVIVKVVCLRGPGENSILLRQQGITVTELDLPTGGLAAPKNIWRWTRGIIKVFLTAKNFRPALIHCWLYPADLIGGLVGYVVKRPVIWGVYSGKVSRCYYRRRSYWLLRICGVLAKYVPVAIISCSCFGRRSHREIGYPKQNHFFVPTGFRTQPASPILRADLRPRSTSQPREVKLGMLGRYTREKSHDLLISMFGELVNRVPNCHLVLAGGVGIDSENIELARMISERGLGNKVTLLGAVKEKREFFQQIDLFLLISESEGFPTVVGEAMTYALPCVVSKVGDAHVLLNDRNQLLLSHNEDELFRKVLPFCLNKDLRKLTGEKNLTRVGKVFPEEKMISRYFRIYERMTHMWEKD